MSPTRHMRAFPAFWFLFITSLFPTVSLASQAEQMQRYEQMLDAQAALIKSLTERVDLLEARLASTTEAIETTPIQSAARGAEPRSMRMDEIGDLNAVVRAGENPGSILLPGPANVSIGFGGYVKSLAYADSDSETEDEYFLPALLGVRRPDREGQYRSSADLSRFALEATAPVDDGRVRAYLEYEFRNDFTLRHAYLQWNGDWGEVTAGQYWSAFMDLQSLPEGVAEPTVSGGIFARQTQFRYSTPAGRPWRWTVSLEDPSTNDVIGVEPLFGRTTVPDAITTLAYNAPGVGHVQVGALARRLKVDTQLGSDDDFGWGLSLSGHLAVGERDRLIAAGVYGEALGRYLLGLSPTAAASVDTGSEIQTRDNFGGYLAYQRYWSPRLRSSFALGYAEADNLAGQPDEAFNNSTYVMGNVLYNLNDRMTLGLEYNYGERENLDGRSLDNHRFVLGFQMF